MGTSGASTASPSSASARVVGSLKKLPSSSHRLTWLIQTAPSTVARQTAPSRWAMIAPGWPRSERSAWAPKRWNSAARSNRARRGSPPRRGCGAQSCPLVGAPVELAVHLLDQGARAADHRRISVAEWLGPEVAARDLRHRLAEPAHWSGGPHGGRGCSCRRRASGRSSLPRCRGHRPRHWPRARSLPTHSCRARSPSRATMAHGLLSGRSERRDSGASPKSTWEGSS
jgi:hypothetical protein